MSQRGRLPTSSRLDRLLDYWMESGDSITFRYTRRLVPDHDLQGFASFVAEFATDFAKLAWTSATPSPLPLSLTRELLPFWKMVEELATGVRPPSVYPKIWEIYQIRLALRRETGKAPTLQAIGAQIGRERARVREKEARLERRLLKPFEAPLAAVRSILSQKGPLLDAAILIPPLQTDAWIIAEDLLRRRDIHLVEDGQSVSSFTRPQLRHYLELECAPFLRRELPSGSLTQVQVEKGVRAWADRHGYGAHVLPPLLRWASQELFRVTEGEWHWRRPPLGKKQDLVAHLLLDYPEGCVIREEVATLRQRAEALRPGAFTTDYNLMYTIAKAPRCESWGYGVYLHQDYIHVQPARLHAVVEWLETQFRLGAPELSAFRAFDQFAAQLVEVGVPNAYALYSCLQRFFDGRFSLGRFSLILPAEQRRRETNQGAIEAFLREHGPQPLAAVQAEFVGRRGWKAKHVSVAIHGSKRVRRLSDGLLGLR